MISIYSSFARRVGEKTNNTDVFSRSRTLWQVDGEACLEIRHSYCLALKRIIEQLFTIVQYAYKKLNLTIRLIMSHERNNVRWARKQIHIDRILGGMNWIYGKIKKICQIIGRYSIAIQVIVWKTNAIEFKCKMAIWAEQRAMESNEFSKPTQLVPTQIKEFGESL